MEIGYLQPLMGEGPTVTVQLLDRPPDLRAQTMAAVRGRRETPNPLGTAVVTLELNEGGSLPTGRATEVRLQSKQGLEASELRTFPWRRVIAAAAAMYQARHTNDVAAWQSSLAASSTSDRSSRPPGRPSKSAAEYKQVADQYQELVSQGVSDPTKRIAEANFVARSTAAGWVRRARERGFLGPAKPGRAG